MLSYFKYDYVAELSNFIFQHRMFEFNIGQNLHFQTFILACQFSESNRVGSLSCSPLPFELTQALNT